MFFSQTRQNLGHFRTAWDLASMSPPRIHTTWLGPCQCLLQFYGNSAISQLQDFRINGILNGDGDLEEIFTAINRCINLVEVKYNFYPLHSNWPGKHPKRDSFFINFTTYCLQVFGCLNGIWVKFFWRDIRGCANITS